MKFILKILKISLVVSLVVIALDTTFNGFRYHKMLEPAYWGTYFFYSFVITFLNSLFFWQYGKRVGWENANLKKVAMASLGSIVLTLSGFFFCRLVDKTIFNNQALDDFLAEESISYYFFPLLFTTIVALGFHLFYFYKALQDKKVKEQKIIAGTASAKFDALKNQLDPHFLFNSLNVLSSLIEENPAMAQRFTSSLSKIYRYVLEQKNKELVSLEEEIKFARTYSELLKVRFEEGLIFEIPDQIKNPEAKIVPLSLQLLLENTIKHNQVSAQSPLRIRIVEKEGQLIIANNLQPKEILKKGSGVGLANIKARYDLVTHRQVTITTTATEFKVALPLLTKITIMEAPSIQDQYEADSYLRAKEMVKNQRAFYGNLTAYCIIIPALAIINFLTTSFYWFFFPMLGWGLGLLFHGMAAFEWSPFLGKDWERRKIEEIIKKEKFQNHTGHGKN